MGRGSGVTHAVQLELSADIRVAGEFAIAITRQTQVAGALPSNQLKMAGQSMPWKLHTIAGLNPNSNLITTLKAPIGVTTMAGANE